MRLPGVASGPFPILGSGSVYELIVRLGVGVLGVLHRAILLPAHGAAAVTAAADARLTGRRPRRQQSPPPPSVTVGVAAVSAVATARPSHAAD